MPCIPVTEKTLTRHCIVVYVSDKNAIINCQSLPLNLSITPLWYTIELCIKVYNCYLYIISFLCITDICLRIITFNTYIHKRSTYLYVLNVIQDSLYLVKLHSTFCCSFSYNTKHAMVFGSSWLQSSSSCLPAHTVYNTTALHWSSL